MTEQEFKQLEREVFAFYLVAKWTFWAILGFSIGWHMDAIVKWIWS